LELETKEALASQDWLNVSSESVLEFLNMDCLNIKEADLLRALIRWGKFQTREDGDDAVENLRIKILPGLQQIRFESFTQLDEVAQLCEEELKEVLTAEEKYSFLISFIKGDRKIMPTSLVSSSKLAPRHFPYTFCPLPFCADKIQNSKGTMRTTLSLKFEVNRKAAIIGVKLNMNAFNHNSLTSITLYKYDDFEGDFIEVGIGVPKSTTLLRGEMFCKINTKESLAADCEYKLTFAFGTSLRDTFGKCRTYSLPKDKNPSVSDGLQLSINSGWLKSFVHIQGILFEKVF
jgi:BTB And C-terminal Kelch